MRRPLARILLLHDVGDSVEDQTRRGAVHGQHALGSVERADILLFGGGHAPQPARKCDRLHAHTVAHQREGPDVLVVVVRRRLMVVRMHDRTAGDRTAGRRRVLRLVMPVLTVVVSVLVRLVVAHGVVVLVLMLRVLVLHVPVLVLPAAATAAADAATAATALIVELRLLVGEPSEVEAAHVDERRRVHAPAHARHDVGLAVDPADALPCLHRATRGD